MRNLIDIVDEAKKAIAPRDQKADYQALYDKAQSLSKMKSALPVIIDGWKKDWINAVSALFNKYKTDHATQEAREQERYGDDYEPAAFDSAGYFEEAASKWWNKNHIVFDAEEELKRLEDEYFDDHPDTEASDQITLFDRQKRLLSVIKFNNMASISGLDGLLTELGYFLDGEFSPINGLECTHDVAQIISNAIPYILWYSKFSITLMNGA